ncbi:MAG: cytochrome c [Steroidobacteraceae bacterium]
MRMGLAILVFALGAVTGAHAAEGGRIYNRECAACHMAEGRGTPNLAPPLREQVACLAQRPPGRAYLAGVLKHGLEGAITVEGARFEGYMPAASRLSAEEKAAVLDYLASLGNRCSEVIEPFTATEVDAALNELKWNSQSLHALREQLMQESPVPAEKTSNAPPPRARLASRAAQDFVLNCQGCHTPEGRAVPGQVPALRGNVGRFLHTAEGRAFVVQVPGVAFAPLENQRLADLLNWMIESLSAAQAPASFTPYTASEVAGYRRQVLMDLDLARLRVVRQLQRQGFPAPQ